MQYSRWCAFFSSKNTVCLRLRIGDMSYVCSNWWLPLSGNYMWCVCVYVFIGLGKSNARVCCSIRLERDSGLKLQVSSSEMHSVSGIDRSDLSRGNRCTGAPRCLTAYFVRLRSPISTHDISFSCHRFLIEKNTHFLYRQSLSKTSRCRGWVARGKFERVDNHIWYICVSAYVCVCPYRRAWRTT